MNRPLIYKKGGNYYYMKGGKMCLLTGGMLKQYQKSGYIDDQGSADQDDLNQMMNSMRNAEVLDPQDDPGVMGNTDKGNKNSMWSNMNTYSNLGNLAATGIKSITNAANQNKKPSDNKYISGAFSGKKEQDRNFGQAFSTTSGAIGSVFPIVGAAMNLGSSLKDAVGQYDPETGLPQTDIQGNIANVISPSNSWKEAFGSFKHGAGEGMKNVALNLLLPGIGEFFKDYSKDRNIINLANNEKQRDENRKNKFTQSDAMGGLHHAKYGQEITTKPMNSNQGNWNAEIEDGEIVLGNPAKMIHGGSSYSSMVSPFAVKFNGDKHGSDTDGDGQEGIPIKAEEGSYVLSDYLKLDGTKAKAGEKTVADEAEPIVESLADMYKNSHDAYKNNPQFIKNQLKELNMIKQQAEEGKLLQQVKKVKGLDELMQLIQANPQLMMPKGQPQGQLPQMNNGLPVQQTGGPIRKDLIKHAQDVKQTPMELMRNMQSANPADYSNFDEEYTSPEGTKYDVDYDMQKEVLEPSIDDYENVFAEPQGVTDPKTGGKLDYKTLEKQAGKGKTGASLFIPSRISQAYGENVFDENGYLIKDFADVLIKDFGGDPEVIYNMDITDVDNEGPGRDAIGRYLQFKTGVRQIDNQNYSNKVDSNVRAAGIEGSGKDVENQTRADDNINLYSWVDDMTKQVKENKGIIPQSLQWLSEDTKDALTQLSREGKSPQDISYTADLKRDYNKAFTGKSTEVGREQTYGLKKSEESGAIDYASHDFKLNPVNGVKMSFNDAFRMARELSLPEFTYNGSKFAAKTRSEDPELARQSDAIKGSLYKKPSGTRVITPQTIDKSVRNPKLELEPVKNKFGGMLNSYQNGGSLNKYKNGDPIKDKVTQMLNEMSGMSDMDKINYLRQSKEPIEIRQMAKSYLENEWDKKNNQSIMQDQKMQDWRDFYKPQLENDRKQKGLDPTTGQPLMTPGGGRINALLQMGGMMEQQGQQQPNESAQHLEQLLAQQFDEQGGMSQGPQPMEQPMGQGQMDPMGTGNVNPNVSPALQQLDPSLQQFFMSLPPDQQEQLLKLPPDQLEIALMNLAQQMAGAGAPQGAQPQMEQPAMKYGGNVELANKLRSLFND